MGTYYALAVIWLNMAALYAKHLPKLGKTHLSLKTKQIAIIDSITAGNKETLGILPTGYGKSLTYQLLPFILSGTVIVFSPLTSIQHQQIVELAETELKCCIFNTKVISHFFFILAAILLLI